MRPKSELVMHTMEFSDLAVMSNGCKPANAVLVVIPVFNRCKLIVEALNAVHDQTLRPTLVVVVDDGSTDATPAIVNTWMGDHPDFNVSLIRIRNQGASAARNIGLSACHQPIDFVAFLDSDDLWPKDFLARSVACLAQEPEASLVVADRIFVKVGGGSGNFVSSRPFSDDPFLEMIRLGAGYGSSALIRASAFRASGGYPEDVPTGHDIVLFEKLAAMGKCLHNLGEPVMMRTWASAPKISQEPHLHLRYPDRYVRWAELYLAICASPAHQASLDSRRELRYQLALAYRFLLALAYEIYQLQPDQVMRVLRRLAQLASLMNKTFSRWLRAAQPKNQL